jgi:hypothetical protein
MNYKTKENVMNTMLGSLGYTAPANFRSTFKGVPIDKYEMVKVFIDFTKYYVMFRGPRPHRGYSTRKRDAKAFDVYQRSDRDTIRIRAELEGFKRGVQWANNRSH